MPPKKKYNRLQPQNDTRSSASQEPNNRGTSNFTCNPPRTGGTPSPRLTQLRQQFAPTDTRRSSSSDQLQEISTDQAIRSSSRQKRPFEQLSSQELPSPETTTREGTELLFREQVTPFSPHEQLFLQQPPIYPVTYSYSDQGIQKTTTLEYHVNQESGTPYTPYAF